MKDDICEHVYFDAAGHYCKLIPRLNKDYPHKHLRVMCFGRKTRENCGAIKRGLTNLGGEMIDTKYQDEIEDARHKQLSLSKITDEDFMDLYVELKSFEKGDIILDGEFHNEK